MISIIRRIESKISDSILRYSIRYSIDCSLIRLISKVAGLKLKCMTANCTSLEDLVDLSYRFGFPPFLPSLFSIKPFQVKDELLELLKLLLKLKPKAICEIGTAWGGCLYLFCRIAPKNAMIISIDLPGGPFGGGYPIWKIPLYKSFAKDNQTIHLIRANSHNPKTLELVKRILGNRMIDFLFIDGDHTYKGVKRDFEMYSPCLLYTSPSPRDRG